MNTKSMKLNDLLCESVINVSLELIVISGRKNSDRPSKIRVRLLSQDPSGGKLIFQIEEFRNNQAFHKNMGQSQTIEYLKETFAPENGYKQMLVKTSTAEYTVLMNKKGDVRISGNDFTERNNPVPPEKITLAGHNKIKNYILKEGTPVPFLVDLGVMNADGTVVVRRYDKFRQINRFLEFIRDIVPNLTAGDPEEISIIDFGCGKSYLTFAVYYYLHELLNLNVKIVGLDLKQDVIENCNRLSRRYGYDKLSFLCGDIADYTETDRVDLVMTLHACDTATDYALEKAVKWNARCILSVPCCQHELNRQIDNELLSPVFRYGVIQERISALLTDGIRAELLRECGYRTQILEFIDMEHTPKNLLIRAVRISEIPFARRSIKPNGQLDELIQSLNVDPTLRRLLKNDQ